VSPNKKINKISSDVDQLLIQKYLYQAMHVQHTGGIQAPAISVCVTDTPNPGRFDPKRHLLQWRIQLGLMANVTFYVKT